MGHVELAAPVTHIWYFKGVPSRLGYLLDLAPKDLEKVIYFAAYMITWVDDEGRHEALPQLEKQLGLEKKQIADRRDNDIETRAKKLEAAAESRASLRAASERRSGSGGGGGGGGSAGCGCGSFAPGGAGPSCGYVAEVVSVEHTPERERARIDAAGGWVSVESELSIAKIQGMDASDPFVARRLQQGRRLESRVSRLCGELGVSRALGDAGYKGAARMASCECR
jgi:DNA-directed RNA polymerase beta' subunit